MNDFPQVYPHAAPWMQNENVAADGSHVELQVGAVYGAVHNVSNYAVHPDDTPQRRQQVAIELLHGGMPRDAERILGDLLRRGHNTSRVAYYYGLAVLSGRSLTEVDHQVHDDFELAWRMTEAAPLDEWKHSLVAMRRFLAAVWRLEVQEPLGAEDEDIVDDAFGTLPDERRAEILRHVDPLRGGVQQGQVDARDEHRVVVARMQPGRENRAWKFFEPDPAQPRLFVPAATEVPGGVWTRVAFGGVLALVGVLILVAGVAHAVAGLLGIPLLALGGYLVVRFRTWQQQLTLALQREDQKHRPVADAPAPVSPGHWVSTSFVVDLHRAVDLCFREGRPHIAGDWNGDTSGLRAHLKDRLVSLYGNAQVQPGALVWLMRWHINRIAARWRSGTLFNYRLGLQPPARVIGWYRFGAGLVVAGLLVLAVSGLVGAAIVLGAGCYLLAANVTSVMAAQRDDKAAALENEQLFEEEQQAYLKRVQLLADRPTDAEMARWLDLDKSYLTAVALHRAGLGRRDLVTHVVMTQRGKHALRARVLHGPVRYSEYVVLVFLLTRSGVREIEVDLDFLTGQVRDERRTSFRYDALASASVAETGVRTANDLGYLPEGARSEPREIVNLSGREFRLSLVSGQTIRVLVENFAGLSDSGLENGADLLRIALQTSGIAGSLHVLEAVAAEGRDWIEREHGRRKRRYDEDWRQLEPKAITTGEVDADDPAARSESERDPGGSSGQQRG